MFDVCSAMMVELEITKMHNIDTVRRSSWEMIANYSKINFPNFFLFDFNFADCCGEQRQRRLITGLVFSVIFLPSVCSGSDMQTNKQSEGEKRDWTIYPSRSTNLLLTNRLKAGRTCGEPSWVSGAVERCLARMYQITIWVCLLTVTLTGKVYQRWTLISNQTLDSWHSTLC